MVSIFLEKKFSMDCNVIGSHKKYKPWFSMTIFTTQFSELKKIHNIYFKLFNLMWKFNQINQKKSKSKLFAKHETHA
jgi:hypothetical protein